MKWFARKFKHTRIQELSKEYAWDIYHAERNMRISLFKEVRELDAVLIKLQNKVEDLGQCERFGKITTDEIRDLITGLANYHDVCVRMAIPDPVRYDIQHIFDKYNIKVEKPGRWIA